MSRNKIVFVGSISWSDAMSGAAQSTAGEQVQREIMRALSNRNDLYGVLMMPLEAFPRGPFFSRRHNAGDRKFWLPFLNLPVVKHLSFAIMLFVLLVRIRPSRIFVYNSYFFQNIALYFYCRFISAGARWCTFIQDVLPVGGGWRAVQRWLDRKSLGMLGACDLVVPVTKQIIEDFGISGRWCVLHGGVTSVMKEGVFDVPAPAEWSPGDGRRKRFMFAGRLVSYNGVDKLVAAWQAQLPDAELHVFGDGPLRSRIEAAGKSCDRIVYRGRVPHDQIVKEYLGMDGVIVLRFSCDIEAEYFFPSKFFEALVAPCHVVVNAFPGTDAELLEGCEVVDDQLIGLGRLIEALPDRLSSEKVDLRRKRAAVNYCYDTQIGNLVACLDGMASGR